MLGDDATASGTIEPGFRQVDGGGEIQSGERLLVMAYIAMWLLMVIYIAIVWRKTRSLEARVLELREQILRPTRDPSEPKA